MKYLKLILLVVVFLLPSTLAAQVVTINPTFATADDAATLTFDATEGNQGLQGFSGEVYLHTGVITNISSNPSDWRYVQSDWAEYPSRLKATSLGDNKWEFSYPVSIREFYGVPESEEIEEIAVLFKGTADGSGDPDRVGRGENNSDIFVELSTGEVSAKWLEPADDFTLLGNDATLRLSGAGTSNTNTLNLTVYQNGSQVVSTTESSIEYNFGPEAEGNYELALVADNGSGVADTALHRIVVLEETFEQVRPDGLKDGITYSDDGTSVQFSLFAPGKELVFLIGDFNDWEVNADYIMKKDSVNADSVWFWTEVSGLTPGEEYGFQYLIEGETRIADPYSELVLDPFNDQYITEETYPNLKPYPSNETTEYVGVIQPGKEEYQWQVTDYELPERKDLVIYELLIRDFIEAHNYQTLTDTLDYLEDLGVNAIELMPVNEFDGNLSWGYNPSFHLALDKYYGTEEAFKRFIDEAHSRGIAVILDIVLNQGTGLHPLYRMYTPEENPYFNEEARHAYNVFNDFNHQYSGTQYYAKRVIEYWINEFNIDGFRWDLTKGFTQLCSADDGACTDGYKQDRIDVLQKYADWQWAQNPDFYVIHEHLGFDNEEAQWVNYRMDEGKGIMVWENLNHQYRQSTMGYADNSDFSLVVPREHQYFQQPFVIGYMESHDEERLMYENLNYGNSAGSYNTSSFDVAIDRMKQAAGFYFTLPGPKMIWQFGELGYDYSINYNGRTGEKPIRWDYLKDPQRRKLLKVYQALINLRKSSEVFTSPDNIRMNLDEDMKWVRMTHSDSDVLIVGNFGVTDGVLETLFPSTGTWYDFYTGEAFEVTNTDSAFNLAPGDMHIYTTRKFETPEQDILTNTEESEENGIPSTFRLEQNYPNPFNPVTNIQYSLPEAGNVQLEVFDITGRKVTELVNQRQAAGSYTINLDASNLGSGVYFYRLKAGGKVFTQKMTLIK